MKMVTRHHDNASYPVGSYGNASDPPPAVKASNYIRRNVLQAERGARYFISALNR